MSRPLPLMGKTHPLTGLPIRAIGWRPDGSPLWPIMGGDPSNDTPERPDDVAQETWDALGDPGKVALTRERTARQEAEKARDTAIRERDAARARPTPPAPSPAQPPTQPATSAPGSQPDIAKLINDGIAAAMKPFQDAEEQRQAERAADRVRTVVLDAAKTLLHDPTDALANIDLSTVIDTNGAADPEKVKAALDGVVQNKPHLAKSTSRVAPPGIGGGGPAAVPDAEKVKAILADMYVSTGARAPKSSA